MPSKRVLITAGVLAVAAGATAIAAQSYRGHHDGWHDGPGGGWRGNREVTKSDYDERTRIRFARMDANGDGVVDAAEAKKLIEARTNRWRQRRIARRMQGRVEGMLRRFDENNDGKISRAEFDERIGFFFARMDLDSDGKITDQDLPPMLRGRGILRGDQQGGGRHARRGPGRMLRMMRGADTNGDGEIARDEAMATAALRFARFDRNKDGNLDKADVEALRAESSDYRVKRFFHRYGASKDGKLTREQFKAERDRRFARWDTNKDGTLSRAELPGRGWWHRWRRWAHDDGDHEGGRRHHGWNRGDDERDGGRWERKRDDDNGQPDRGPATREDRRL